MSDRSNVCPLRPAATAIPQLDYLDAAARVALIRGMRRKGWTIEQLARECDVDKSTACRWLSGESRVPGRALVAVGAVANENGEERAA